MPDGAITLPRLRCITPLVQDWAYLAQHMRADERAQWESVHGAAFDVDAAARGFLALTGPSWALIDRRGRPVVAGGFELVRPKVWQTYMAGTEEGWSAHWFAITRECRRLMAALFDGGHAHRVQTYALEARRDAHRWYERGLQQRFEGVHAQLFADGQSAVCYARTLDMHRRCADGQ